MSRGVQLTASGKAPLSSCCWWECPLGCWEPPGARVPLSPMTPGAEPEPCWEGCPESHRRALAEPNRPPLPSPATAGGTAWPCTPVPALASAPVPALRTARRGQCDPARDRHKGSQGHGDPGTGQCCCRDPEGDPNKQGSVAGPPSGAQLGPEGAGNQLGSGASPPAAASSGQWGPPGSCRAPGQHRLSGNGS